MLSIHAEGFTLTPAIRDHIQIHVQKLFVLMPEDTRFNVFLSEPAQSNFMAVIRTHGWGKDFVVRSEGKNLYHVIEQARFHLHRKIAEEKRQWIHQRRKDEKTRQWNLSYTA